MSNTDNENSKNTPDGQAMGNEKSTATVEELETPNEELQSSNE
ncbi:MAG: hypothetical protein ACLFM7_10570 [Bacteroidales bacterium]